MPQNRLISGFEGENIMPKYRESGMPSEDMWEGFYNPGEILLQLKVNKCQRGSLLRLQELELEGKSLR